jgi:iron complex outermembrane receptor protein
MRVCYCLAGLGLCLAVGLDGAAAQATPRGRVYGIVVEAESGQPIVAAQVRLLPLHVLELTHADGRFAIDDVVPGTYRLVVERLGYRTVTRETVVSPGNAEELRIALSIAAVNLSEIVVTGTLGARSRDDVLSPVSILTGAELDRRVGQTVADMLENKPGISLTALGPATGRPVIRGLGGDRILMLEDGQRMGDVSSLSSDHAVATDPLTAKQVEIVRGPMSLLYGSSALGGVVNVIREEIPTTLPHEPHGAFSVQGSTVNRGATGGGHAVLAVGGFAVRGEASARTSGDLSTPAGSLINTDSRSLDAAIGVGLPATWGHAGVSYRFFGNDYGIPGGFVGGHAQGVDIEMRRHVLRGNLELHRGDRFFNEIRLSGGFTDFHLSELEQSGTIGTQFLQDLLQADLVARHGARGWLNEGAAGVRAQYRDVVTGGSLRTPSTYDVALAGFAIEEVGDAALRFQLGARFDWARYVPRDTTSFVTAGGQRVPVRPRNFGSVSGSFGLLWAVSHVVRLGASIARAYRTPDFNELFSNGPHLAANSFDVGDPALGQETGLGFDVFARLTHEAVQAEIAAYHNTLSDYIFPSSRGRAELGTQGERPRFQYTNEDARFTGIEGELVASLSSALRLEASGSVVRARFTSERAPIPVITPTDTSFVAASGYPPLIPPASGRIGLRIDQPGRFLGAGLKAVARQDRLGDFETETSGYMLGDFTAGVRLVRGAMLHSLTLRVDNLFDREYRDHMSRTKEIMPGAGRNVSLLYRLVF